MKIRPVKKCPELACALLFALAIFVAARPAVANTELWVGVANTSTTTNWSDNANWIIPAGGSANGPNQNDVIFGDNGAAAAAGTINSVVDQNGLNPVSLTFTNGAGGSKFHTVLVPAGISATNSGAFTVGEINLGVINWVTTVNWVGAGTLVQNGSTFTVDNSSAGASGVLATLDMSGLSNFVGNAISTLNIAGGGSSEARGTGKLNLAQTSVITATNLTMNTGGGNAGVGATLNLGSTTNTINVTTFVAGQTKGNSGVVQFPTSTGGLRIRGVTGADADRAVTFTLGDRNNSGTGTTLGSFLFNGHMVDIKGTTMTLGLDRSSSSGSTHAGNGTVQFDTGTIDVTTLNMAVSTSAGTVSSAAGVITVGGGVGTGTLIVGAGGISLGNKSGGSTGATGNLNVSNGVVNCSGNITKVNTGAVGTLNFITNGSLTMLSGAVIGTLAIPIDVVNLTNATVQWAVVSGTTNLVATTLNLGASNSISVSALPAVNSYNPPTQFPMIKRTTLNVAGGVFNVGLTLPGTYQGYVSNNTATATIDVVITNGPALPKVVVWQGVPGSGTWDTSTSVWTNSVGAAVNYADGDLAVFDDSAATNVVNLAATRSPSAITNNSTANYTFVGSGGISGANLTKSGAGTLTIANTGANSFAGTIALNAGVLAFNRSDNFTVANVISGGGGLSQLGSGTNTLTGVNTYGGATVISGGMITANNAAAGNSSLGAFGGQVTITNGGTLDVENSTANIMSFTNLTDNGGKQFFISGAGAGGNGCIVNNGNVNQQNAFQRITLTGNATIGGPARWDLRVPDGKFNPILDLNGFNLTKNGTNQMSWVAVIVTNNGNIVINSGILSFETTSTFANGTGTVTVNPGGVMGHFREVAGQFTRPIVLNGGIIRDLNGTPGSTNDSPITLTANSFLDLNVNSTNLTQLNGAISESAGSFGLTKTNIGSFALSGTNTYSGNTYIVQGRLALVNNGSISNSANIIVAGNATFDVSALASPFSLNIGQTLSNTTSGALINGNANSASGIIALNYASGTPSFISTNGTLTLSASTTINVRNTGSALASGSYKLISAASAANVGTVAGTVPAVAVSGGGIAAAQHASLSIVAGELFLNVTNHAPTIAGPVTNSFTSGLSGKVAVADLRTAAGWSDADGDTVSLSSVAALSANGTNVSTDGTFIYYQGVVTAEDRIDYTISDGNLTASGSVYLEAISQPGTSQIGNPTTDGNGHPSFSGFGTPGYVYGIESETNLGGVWIEAGAVTVSPTGSWNFTDTNQTSPPQIFYRLYYPDNPGNPPQ